MAQEDSAMTCLNLLPFIEDSDKDIGVYVRFYLTAGEDIDCSGT